jgi:hypothetical protein
MKSIVTNQTILAKKKLQNHNRKKQYHLELIFIRELRNCIKIQKVFFIANRANQDEIENYLI